MTSFEWFALYTMVLGMIALLLIVGNAIRIRGSFSRQIARDKANCTRNRAGGWAEYSPNRNRRIS